jgi:hypothetical protein
MKDVYMHAGSDVRGAVQDGAIHIKVSTPSVNPVELSVRAADELGVRSSDVRGGPGRSR